MVKGDYDVIVFVVPTGPPLSYASGYHSGSRMSRLHVMKACIYSALLSSNDAAVAEVVSFNGVLGRVFTVDGCCESETVSVKFKRVAVTSRDRRIKGRKNPVRDRDERSRYCDKFGTSRRTGGNKVHSRDWSTT